ncbi:MAG: ABC transporter ATP-binding protein [Rhodobacteraceae bacterium]|nr:ABC transporter ATP-binding protein [Paracoccaceae bacterium]
MPGFVEVRGLRKRFGNTWAIRDVSFEVEAGKLLVLLGPSGCGKTTTLRCIGGLEHPEAGEIVIDGDHVTDVSQHVFLQPEARGMGMVAQSYAIWPHMSVFENVAFPLKMKKCGRELIRKRVRDALDVVRLGDLGNRNATDLSGGQQQRVALARAIVGRPKVLLFDEPLSNLDAKLREEMRFFLKDIQQEISTTAIYVTHDQAEAMALGDELLVMNAGRIEQRGSARSLYCEPETRFVANFIGIASFIEATVQSVDAGDSRTVLVALHAAGGQAQTLRVRNQGAQVGSQVVVAIRPEWVRLHSHSIDSKDNLIEGVVHKCQFLGDRTEVLVDTDYEQMRVWADGIADIRAGERIKLEVDGERCIALPAGKKTGQE